MQKEEQMMQEQESTKVLTYIKEEQETNINFNSAELYAVVYCCQLKRIRELDRLCESNPESYTKKKEFFYVVSDQSLIKFRKPRNISEKHKEVLRTRFARKD